MIRESANVTRMGRERWIAAAYVLLLVGLVTSRLTLVGHELAGHGGAVYAVGGSVETYQLFWFGGGWIEYDWTSERSVTDGLIVAMAGMAFEIVIGLGALAIATARIWSNSVARVTLEGFATLNLIHASFYLASGTYHGFGDGRLLAQQLGDDRWLVVLPACVLVVALGYHLPMRLARRVASWFRGSARARLVAVLGAAAIAAAGHGALTAAERAATDDAIYAGVMQHDSERKVEREVAIYRQHQIRQGTVPSAEQLAEVRAKAEQAHRELPLRWILAGFLALACLAGTVVGVRGAEAAAARGEPPGPSRRELWGLTMAMAGAMTIIALLRWLAPVGG